jgi:hypothetical protein
MVGGLAAFLAVGSLRIGAGNWIGLRLPVRQIWARFLGYLADQGASPALVMAVVAAAAITLLGAAWALWLALALRDATPETPMDDPAER